MEVIKYEENWGEILFPTGFEEMLKGLSMEEQINCFRTSSRRTHSATGFASRTVEDGYKRLEEDPDVQGVIVKDNMIVGVMMNDAWNRTVPCLPEQRVCTYYASDNNGAGYKERIDYTWLLCVPGNFEK